MSNQLEAFADSDWAGERKTAKSTSGGAIMWGTHLLKSWSSTQNTIALSSGEAELIALVKCSSELLGLRSLLKDWGEDLAGCIYADSTAALAMVKSRSERDMRAMGVKGHV